MLIWKTVDTLRLDIFVFSLVSAEIDFVLGNAAFKVLEYLRTCNIVYLINGPGVTFRIFDWHMLKKGILSYQIT